MSRLVLKICLRKMAADMEKHKQKTTTEHHTTLPSQKSNYKQKLTKNYKKTINIVAFHPAISFPHLQSRPWECWAPSRWPW